MENFEYYNPVKVVFGAGVLDQVGTYAAFKNATGILAAGRASCVA